MRTYQVDLQFANLVADDAYIAKLANSGGDCIGELVAGDYLIDDGARAIDGFARVGEQEHRAMLCRDFAHRFQSESLPLM